MQLPQAPREGGEWKRSEHFAYVGTAPNTTWHGYLAGPVMWFECHQPKKTKPCLAIMTNRAVVCPWCRPEFPIVTRGYVPLYRQSDWAPRCVIVNDLYRDLCDKLRTHERVTIGKEDEPTDPVWITRAMSSTPVFNTTLKHRFAPVDLTGSLLRIWANADLVKWFADECRKQSDNALSPPVTGKQVTEWERFVELGSRGTMVGEVVAGDGATTEQDVDQDREKLRALVAKDKGHANGNGKKKKKPEE